MSAYYNEIDGYCCDRLQDLMDAGRIMPGMIDDRSIESVSPDDVAGYGRVHFFAGIGGWDLALQLADWPAGEEVWTGSCPCQPFSAAGSRKGAADKRHLWPEFRRLIAQRRPAVVFGEQVASPDGRQWFSGVRVDMEELGYAVGGADLCAASVGAPHQRQRLYFVADANGWDASTEGLQRSGEQRQFASNRGNRPWDRYDVVTDGQKSWRVEPGTFPLVDGVPHRLAQLRGYGNAIVPELAAEFIGAYMSADISTPAGGPRGAASTPNTPPTTPLEGK